MRMLTLLSSLSRLSRIFLAGAFVFAVSGPVAVAEEENSARAAEAKEAAEEDAAEEKLDSETLKKLFEGRMALTPDGPDKENPEVVGVFVSEGKTYQLKLTDPELLKELKPLQNKPITLNGKIRNKGKYFIVVGIMSGGAAPAFGRRRGGI